MITAKRNRLTSTGPRTAKGKAVSSKNARNEAAVFSVPKIQGRAGLTGRTVLLTSDDPAAFEQHVGSYFEEYKPEGLRERELVQSLAETRWRLNRIFALEAAIFAQAIPGAEEGAPAPGNLENLLKHEKTLRNLHLQEARLHRRFEKDLAEFDELQQGRFRDEMIGTDSAAVTPNGDPKLGSNFQMLKDMLEMDGFQLPNASKSSSAHPPSPFKRSA
jgi:hypothetical protein